MLWRRFGLAMANRNLRLARFLREAMPAADRSPADLWLSVAADPQQILDAARFPEHELRIAPIIADALNHWGQRDPLAAAAALDLLKARYPALALQWGEVERSLALRIASDYHPTALARLSALAEAASDAAVREWRVRVCLQAKDWAAALRWLELLPVAERDSPRWRYWRGRTLNYWAGATKPVRLTKPSPASGIITVFWPPTGWASPTPSPTSRCRRQRPN